MEVNTSNKGINLKTEELKIMDDTCHAFAQFCPVGRARSKTSRTRALICIGVTKHTVVPLQHLGFFKVSFVLETLANTMLLFII